MNLRTIFALAACCLAASCGGGSGSSGDGVTAAANQPPGQVALVEVSSGNVGALTASWLPAVDDSTRATELKYQVHASTDLAFTPSAATQVFQGTGVTTATVSSGLLAGKVYAVRLVALDAQGASAVSAPVRITVADTAATQVPGTQVLAFTAAQFSSVTPSTVEFPAGVAAPVVGAFISSADANNGVGMLRKVLAVSQTAGGTTVQTRTASLNEVLSDAQISTTIKMDAVAPATANSAVGIGRARALTVAADGSVNRYQYDWPEAGLKYSSGMLPATATLPGGARMKALSATGSATIQATTAPTFTSSNLVTVTRSWGKALGNSRITMAAGASGTSDLVAAIINESIPWFSSSAVGICSVRYGAIVSNGSDSKPSGIHISSGKFDIGQSEVATGRIKQATQTINFSADAGTAAAAPYKVVATVELDDAGDNCAGNSGLKRWREEIAFELEIFVTDDAQLPKGESTTAEFTASAGYKITNVIETTFAPQVEVAATLAHGSLTYARIAVLASPRIDQVLTVDANAAATMDVIKPIIADRKFFKVFMAPGGIPVVVSGVFTLKMRIEGSVTGELHGTEKFSIGFDDITYGIEFRNGVPAIVQSVVPVYSLRMAGDGHAQADLRISVLPGLELTGYEVLTGKAVLEPYLAANVAIAGKVQMDAEVDFDAIQTNLALDADYRLTSTRLSTGVNAWVYADFHVWDLNLAVYPDGAKKDDYKSFKQIPLVADTAIADLPQLVATVPATATNTLAGNSRAIKVVATATNVPNPLQSLFPNLPASYITWQRWTAPRLIAPLGTTPGSYSVVPDPDGADGVYWVTVSEPGVYTLRIGGYSIWGTWARQYTEVQIDATDANSNGIPDFWERRYGLTGTGADIAAADSDRDGKSNLQEWRDGTDPLKPNIATGTAVISDITDDFGLQVGLVAPGASTDDKTPTLRGIISSALSNGQNLVVLDNGVLAGLANVTGTSWDFTPSALALGNHSFTVAIQQTNGTVGVSSGPRTLTVVAPAAPPASAPLLTLSAAPSSIINGQATTLSWSSTNATSCTASGGWTGSKGTSGSLSVSPATSTTYTLSCAGAGGSSYTATTVTVTQSVPSGISASANGVGQVTLSWTASTAATSYNIYAALVSGVTKNNYSSLAGGKKIAATGSPFTVSGLLVGASYYFVVTAVSASGESGESSQVSSIPASANAPPAAGSLNDTGSQASQCFQAGSDVRVVCTDVSATSLSSAQDGMTGRDANPATNSGTDGKLGFSFTSVQGGCVLDNVTALMWEVKTTDGALRDWRTQFTAYGDARVGSALAYAAAVNATSLCGYSDWRVPTIREQQSIVDYGAESPAIDRDWFPNTQVDLYWSPPISNGYPMILSLQTGETSYASNSNPIYGDPNSGAATPNYVRLVRGGKVPPSYRYSVSSDGQEVTDYASGLIWRRCAEGMAFSGGTCTLTASKFTHEGALQLAAARASSTGIAWRLPNVKELYSLSDYSGSADTSAFPATPVTPAGQDFFWSATRIWGIFSKAWIVGFGSGEVSANFFTNRSQTNYVRLVRDMP